MVLFAGSFQTSISFIYMHEILCSKQSLSVLRCDVELKPVVTMVQKTIHRNVVVDQPFLDCSHCIVGSSKCICHLLRGPVLSVVGRLRMRDLVEKLSCSMEILLSETDTHRDEGIAGKSVLSCPASI